MWVHTVRTEASLSSIWQRIVYLWRLWCCGGEVGENLEVLSFTCPCVRPQWVASTNSTINTYTSTLWYSPWQDWTRICFSLSNSKSYCTLPDVGAWSNTGKFMANPQSPNEMIHLLTPKPQKNPIDRSSSIKVTKDQKLYINFKRIFSSNKGTSMLRTVLATDSDCRILGG